MSTNQIHPLHHMLAGGIGGGVADALVHPLLTIKARLQVQGAQPRAGTGFAAYHYTGTFDAFRSILRTEGAGGLYKGASAIVWATPACSLYFLGYETAKKAGENTPAVHAGAGFFAQLCGSLLWVPTDVLKERLQVQAHVQKGYESYLRAVRTVVAEGGVRRLYKGYWAHQMTYGPFNSVYFALYEQCKAAGRERVGGDANLTYGFLAASALYSGTVASVLTAPMDNVKTRLQIQGTPMGNGTTAPSFNGFVDCLKTVWRSEGARGFFRGTGARVVSMAPKTGITMTAYEVALSLIRDQGSGGGGGEQ